MRGNGVDAAKIKRKPNDHGGRVKKQNEQQRKSLSVEVEGGKNEEECGQNTDANPGPAETETVTKKHKKKARTFIEDDVSRDWEPKKRAACKEYASSRALGSDVQVDVAGEHYPEGCRDENDDSDKEKVDEYDIGREQGLNNEEVSGENDDDNSSHNPITGQTVTEKGKTRAKQSNLKIACGAGGKDEVKGDRDSIEEANDVSLLCSDNPMGGRHDVGEGSKMHAKQSGKNVRNNDQKEHHRGDGDKSDEQAEVEGGHHTETEKQKRRAAASTEKDASQDCKSKNRGEHCGGSNVLYDALTRCNPPPIPPNKWKSIFYFVLEQHGFFGDNGFRDSVYALISMKNEFKEGDHAIKSFLRGHRAQLLKEAAQQYPLLGKAKYRDGVPFLESVYDDAFKVDASKIRHLLSTTDSGRKADMEAAIEELVRCRQAFEFFGGSYITEETFSVLCKQKEREWTLFEEANRILTTAQATKESQMCNMICSKFSIRLDDVSADWDVPQQKERKQVKHATEQETEPETGIEAVAQQQEQCRKKSVPCPVEGCNFFIDTMHASSIPLDDNGKFNYCAFWSGRRLEGLRSKFRTHAVTTPHANYAEAALFTFCRHQERGRIGKNGKNRDKELKLTPSEGSQKNKKKSACWELMLQVLPLCVPKLTDVVRLWHVEVARMVSLFHNALASKTRSAMIMSLDETIEEGLRVFTKLEECRMQMYDGAIRRKDAELKMVDRRDMLGRCAAGYNRSLELYFRADKRTKWEPYFNSLLDKMRREDIVICSFFVPLSVIHLTARVRDLRREIEERNPRSLGQMNFGAMGVLYQLFHLHDSNIAQVEASQVDNLLEVLMLRFCQANSLDSNFVKSQGAENASVEASWIMEQSRYFKGWRNVAVDEELSQALERLPKDVASAAAEDKGWGVTPSAFWDIQVRYLFDSLRSNGLDCYASCGTVDVTPIRSTYKYVDFVPEGNDNSNKCLQAGDTVRYYVHEMDSWGEGTISEVKEINTNGIDDEEEDANMPITLYPAYHLRPNDVVTKTVVGKVGGASGLPIRDFFFIPSVKKLSQGPFNQLNQPKKGRCKVVDDKKRTTCLFRQTVPTWQAQLERDTSVDLNQWFCQMFSEHALNL